MQWLGAAQHALDNGTPALWIVLATARGSAPRDPGAAMLVTATDFAGTLGGGTLEHRAIALARALMARGVDGAHLRVPLGPSLGQCCGGLVTLAFKRLCDADRAWLRRVQQHSALPAPVMLGLTLPPPQPIEAAERGEALDAAVMIDPADAALTVALRGAVLPVVLFGAGHVGRALVRALTPLPVATTWVDSREDEFPSAAPAHTRIEATDVPLAEVAAATPGSAFVVATHLHSLDEEIAEAVLRRGDFAWLGVIGSAPKRQRFERRFAARGLPPALIQQMQMPMGTVTSKEPEVIAASVAVELMRVRAASSQAQATHVPSIGYSMRATLIQDQQVE
jgi:xanthine dehydrogenase accessory factor